MLYSLHLFRALTRRRCCPWFSSNFNSILFLTVLFSFSPSLTTLTSRST